MSGLCFSSLKLSRGSDALGFDTWRGIGDVVAGMARQEYDLKLRRYNGRGWRAMFFLSGLSTRSLRMLAARRRQVRGRRGRATQARGTGA